MICEVSELKLFSGTFSILENALNYSSLKQKVISQNIANVDTPNYKAKDVSFQTVFQQEVNSSFENIRTDKRHFRFEGPSTGSNAVVTKKSVSYNQNGNSVDIDKEMANLATNQIYYNALIERINGKFSSLQSVIKGGK
jgi:flagellar basal-body rod protein FlgB